VEGEFSEVREHGERAAAAMPRPFTVAA
jgi:hypothetical protein